MSVRSMTGFGRGEAADARTRVSVELSCVNRKQLDCNLSLPRELLALEPRLQAVIRGRLSRGYVKGLVVVTVTGEATVSEALCAQATAQIGVLRQLAARMGLPDDLTASTLTRLPDLLRSAPSAADIEQVGALAEQALSLALDALDAMRLHEGAALATDIRARLATLDGLRAGIARLAAEVPRAYQATLKARLESLLPGGAGIDDALVARELAVFADRCDVSEELTRLIAHFAHAETLLAGGEPCGRALDFLCQEFFREINTTGSKAADAEITRQVIAFKALLETVREQIQNIE